MSVVVWWYCRELAATEKWPIEKGMRMRKLGVNECKWSVESSGGEGDGSEGSATETESGKRKAIDKCDQCHYQVMVVVS